MVWWKPVEAIRRDHAGVFVVDRYRPRDRRAIRDICVTTAWMGDPAPRRIVDEWIWAEFWTRYFTDRESRHVWVVRDTPASEVVGYLTGTADVARVDRYVPFLLPGIAARAIRRRLLRRADSRRAIVAILKSLVSGELEVPAWIRRRFPATCHIDLLPQARGQGLGARLMHTFLAQMRAIGLPGVHVQSLAANEPVARLNRRAGFTPIHTATLHAFAHIDGQPTAVVTWAMRL